jgi:hypothetical protein
MNEAKVDSSNTCSCKAKHPQWFIVQMRTVLRWRVHIFLSLFLRKKSNQKSRPKTNTARFRKGALIKLLYYCCFGFGKKK